MFLTDTVSVGKYRRTGDGYLVADARVARTGVQEYLGSELGRPDLGIVRVYRAPEEVFSDEAMHSYAYRPLTIEHPSKMVDADTWKAVSVGQTGGEVQQEGKFVRVPLVMMDSAAIKEFEAGKRELSMGYSAEIVFEDGVSPDGEAYDAVQRSLRMNHLAVVGKARGGNELRIGDGRTPGGKDRADKPPMETPKMSDNTRTILVDGLSVNCTDAGIQAITKLQGQLKDAETAHQKLVSDHASAIADKDKAMAKVEAERDDLKAKVLSDADLDKRVQDRADLIAAAKSIADGDYTGKSDADIRKAVVVAKLGDAAVKDKSEAYVDARFDILLEDAKKDPVTRALNGTTRTAVADNGYSASVEALDFRTRNQKKEA